MLCAGLGTRLAPLTDTIPKPLLPIRGRTVLERTLDRLERVGCEAVALNLHHLGPAIRETIGPRHGTMAIEYSEEAEILGTLGALAALRGFVAEADFIFLINGDSVCRWPLEELLQLHIARRPRATLLLNRARPAAPASTPAGAAWRSSSRPTPRSTRATAAARSSTSTVRWSGSTPPSPAPPASNVGVGFTIPINLARTVAISLIETGVAKRGWLGVRGIVVSSDSLKREGIRSPGGFLLRARGKGLAGPARRPAGEHDRREGGRAAASRRSTSSTRDWRRRGRPAR